MLSLKFLLIQTEAGFDLVNATQKVAQNSLACNYVFSNFALDPSLFFVDVEVLCSDYEVC